MIAAGEASEKRYIGALATPAEHRRFPRPPARPSARPRHLPAGERRQEAGRGDDGGFSPKSAMETKREGDEKDERI